VQIVTRQALNRLRTLSRRREEYVGQWLPEPLLTGADVAAVRQIARRARDRVTARRPRIPVSRAEQQAAVEQFQAALTTGDLQGLLDVLAPDVVLVADGGGLAPAAIRPVSGAKTVARLLSRFTALAPGARVGTTWLNGAPALRIDPAGEFDTAVSLAIENGRITGIYAIRNPQKLARLDEPASLAR
jgi:RNA polymerase sigma-70 factor (ECF subfamily)